MAVLGMVGGGKFNEVIRQWGVANLMRLLDNAELMNGFKLDFT